MPSAVPHELHERGHVCAGGMNLGGGRDHEDGGTLDIGAGGAVLFDQLGHGHGMLSRVGAVGDFAAPAPGDHDGEYQHANGERHKAALQEF